MKLELKLLLEHFELNICLSKNYLIRQHFDKNYCVAYLRNIAVCLAKKQKKKNIFIQTMFKTKKI